ncbi:MAG TPA: response regulator transcription factor [Anaerolineaceae bacterium]
MLIAAPTAAMRAGLAALLDGTPEIKVVGQGISLPDLDYSSAVDVAVLYPDTKVPGEYRDLAGWRQAVDETHEGPAVLVLTEDGDDAAAVAELSPHAWGVLLPDASAEELQAAVRALAEGLAVASPMLLRTRMAPALPVSERREGLGPALLTRREDEILQLLAQGLANKQIAEALKISPHTVKFHIGAIYEKLGATNRADAVRLGLQMGQLTL